MTTQTWHLLTLSQPNGKQPILYDAADFPNCQMSFRGVMWFFLRTTEEPVYHRSFIQISEGYFHSSTKVLLQWYSSENVIWFLLRCLQTFRFSEALLGSHSVLQGSTVLNNRNALPPPTKKFHSPSIENKNSPKCRTTPDHWMLNFFLCCKTLPCFLKFTYDKAMLSHFGIVMNSPERVCKEDGLNEHGKKFLCVGLQHKVCSPSLYWSSR